MANVTLTEVGNGVILLSPRLSEVSWRQSDHCNFFVLQRNKLHVAAESPKKHHPGQYPTATWRADPIGELGHMVATNRDRCCSVPHLPAVTSHQASYNL
jgi:hypothetical protein